MRGLPPHLRRPGGRRCRLAQAARRANLPVSLGQPPRWWSLPPGSPSGSRSISSATHTGRAIVQSVNGTLYEISATGNPVRSQRDRICRTASKSAPPKIRARCWNCATAAVVELRERSGFSTTQSAGDLTVHLDRGSIIVQAAKRRKGHSMWRPPIAGSPSPARCSASARASRARACRVVEGEVHVSQNNTGEGAASRQTRPSPAPTWNPSR